MHSRIKHTGKSVSRITVKKNVQRHLMQGVFDIYCTHADEKH